MKQAKRRPLPSVTRLATVKQMRRLMATASRRIGVVDLKVIIEEGRADRVILGAMLDQMVKTTLSAESAVDNALAEIEVSNQRVETMERAANAKATDEDGAV